MTRSLIVTAGNVLYCDNLDRLNTSRPSQPISSVEVVARGNWCQALGGRPNSALVGE